MAIRVRPLSGGDVQALQPIDGSYAERHAVEEMASAAALRFFERSGHSFLAELVDVDGSARAVGFLLAQAVWSGSRPVVHLMRAATEAQASYEASGSLVKVLVKSAYDAGVYDLLARVPSSDSELAQQLQLESFQPDEQLCFVRVLGSRGAAVNSQASGAAVGRADV